MSEKDPFDFFDLSDLPETLQEKLTSDTDGDVRAWADVVKKGAERGFNELSINQIIAAGSRMGLQIKTQTTLRNYLNRAVKMKLIGKPTRMTYGADVSKVVADDAEDAAEAVAQVEAAVAAEVDPLADL